MKKKEFLSLHKRLLKTGLTEVGATSGGGLCNVEFRGKKLEENPIFRYFDFDLSSELYYSYWAAETLKTWVKGPDPVRWEYGPIRQNIILLCACLNNEL